jgi:hypothetical protein
MKKQTLIRNLQRAVDNLPNLQLPASIEAVYAFGSILREKKNPGDIDLIILYTQTNQQLDEWNNFVKNFSRKDYYGQTSPIQEIEKDLAEFQEFPLHEAVRNPTLSSILRKHNIDPFWAGCFSWNEVLGPYPEDFSPKLSQVLKRTIFGRRAKGFHDIDFMGKLTIDTQPLEPYQQNNCLVWSKEKPDILSNINGRTMPEKVSLLYSVLDQLLKHDLPLRESEFLEAKKAAMEVIAKLGATTNIDALENKHLRIEHTGLEDLKDVTEKVEQARTELKKYDAEIVILRVISGFCDFTEDGYSKEQLLSQDVIHRSLTRNLSEGEVRKILRAIGLPEDVIIQVGPKMTFKIARNPEEKEKIITEARIEEQHIKVLTQLKTIVHSIDKRAEVRLDYHEDNRLKELTIFFHFPTYNLNEEQISALDREKKSKGFQVRNTPNVLIFYKLRPLLGMETCNELKSIAKELMTSTERSE